MHSFLKQSTATQARAVGPFIDDTDFKTAKTGLTIANTDVKLVKNGAASVNKNSGGGTHRVNGIYELVFDATDTNTVGELNVSIVVAGALPVFCTFVVLEEAIYDALFGASAAGFDASQRVDVGRVLGTAQTAGDIIGDTNDIQARLPAALDAGRMVCKAEVVTDKTGYAIGTGGIASTSFAAGAIDAAALAANSIGASELAADACEKIADALLARNVAGGSNTGRLVKEALYVLRNRVAIAAGTLTAYQTDDVTPAFTAAVTTAAGNPITEIDPT